MIAIRHAKKGFLCYETESALGQLEVIEALNDVFEPNELVIANGCEFRSTPLLQAIKKLTLSNPKALAYILYNFQLATIDDHMSFFHELNMIRDPWYRLDRLFLIGLTKSFKKELAMCAPDFNSFFLSSFHFYSLKQYAVANAENDKTVGSGPIDLGVPYIGHPFGNSMSVEAIEFARKRFLEMESSLRDAEEESPEHDLLILAMLQSWLDGQGGSIDSVIKVLDSLLQRHENWQKRILNDNNLMIIAEVFSRLCQYKQSIKFYNIAFEIRKDILGDKNIKTAETCISMAKVYSILGDWKQTEELIRHAISICEINMDLFQYEAYSIYSDAAICCFNLGRYQQSLDWFNISLSVGKKLGSNNPYVATTLNNISLVHYALGDYEGFLECSSSILPILNKKQNQLAMVAALTNIGAYNIVHGDYCKAKDWLKMALAKEESIGSSHLGISLAYLNLAVACSCLGENAEAQRNANKCLEVNVGLFGDNHLNTAYAYEGFAYVSCIMKNYGDALKYCLKALEIRKSNFGDNHHETISAHMRIEFINSKLAESC
jgi:tetratricopeptide (TPR) repeat protein